MRKLRTFYLAMMAIASLNFLSSCGDDNEPNPAPTITFSPTAETISASPTEPYSVSFAVTSSDKLKEFTITKATPSATVEVIKVTDFPKAGFDYTLNDTVAANATPGTQIIYTVTAKTSKDEVTSRNFTVNVVASPSTYSATILGNQNAAAGSFFSAIDGSVLTSAAANAASQKVDLVYYYSVGGSAATDKATLASPTDATAQLVYNGAPGVTANIPSWATKNNTIIKKTGTVAQYDAAVYGGQIAAIYTSSTTATSTKVANLAVNDVFTFVTARGNYAVAKVTNVTVPNAGNGNQSVITISVKVQN